MDASLPCRQYPPPIRKIMIARSLTKFFGASASLIAGEVGSVPAMKAGSSACSCYSKHLGFYIAVMPMHVALTAASETYRTSLSAHQLNGHFWFKSDASE